MAFQPGQKVVCVKDDGQLCEPFVVKGQIYTITRVYMKAGILLCLDFAEIPSPPSYGCFPAKYFRRVVEKKTDISIFTRMLKTEHSPVLTD